jgi:diguanylate cyclase (GGDEF)-like protein
VTGKPPPPLIHSNQFLRTLLTGSWLGTTLLLSLILTLLNLGQHQARIVRDGDQASHMVSASLRTPLSFSQRQYLAEAYGQSSREHRVEGMNVLMVVDRSGRIVISSRPTWRHLRIDDPVFDRMEGDDSDFQEVVNCFRNRRIDCIQIRSIDWHVHVDGVTVVRPVSMPSMDLGLPRQPFLVLVNFDAGILLNDLLQDMPRLILLAMLISSLLIGSLWFFLSARLLPQLMEVVHTDSLTQLMNRTSFMELAMDLLAEAEERKAEMVFAILDIDHFKKINDTYGHGCGDEALASVGSLLLMVTRPDDLVCRFGGEEFAMLLAAPSEAANKSLERLRLQLEMNTLHHLGHRIPLTASIGVAATLDCGYNLDFLYNSADKALYAAKNGGRNRLEWNRGDIMTRLTILQNSSPG